MEGTKDWVIRWFVDNANADEQKLRENERENYFDGGFIDSFTFISLISEIEEAFGIEFDNEQFVDRKFATVAGLAGIIDALRQDNGK